MLRGSPTAVGWPKVALGVVRVPKVPLGIMLLRWLSVLKASAMASRRTCSAMAKVRLRRALMLKKSKPMPALRPMRVPGRASVQGLRPLVAERV